MRQLQMQFSDVAIEWRVKAGLCDATILSFVGAQSFCVRIFSAKKPSIRFLTEAQGVENTAPRWKIQAGRRWRANVAGLFRLGAAFTLSAQFVGFRHGQKFIVGVQPRKIPARPAIENSSLPEIDIQEAQRGAAG